MNKLALKKFLIRSLIALELTNGFLNTNTQEVYAKDSIEIENNNEEDRILIVENNKNLLLIALTCGDYKYVTLGYKFSKDNAVWFKDAMNGRSYNMNRIEKFIDKTYPELVYTEIENVLPEELKNRDYLTKEEAQNLISRFSVVDVTIQLSGLTEEYYDFIYQSFAGERIKNSKDLHTANCSLFRDPYDVFNRSNVEDEFDEKTEIIDKEAMNFKLGFYEYPGIYECYKTIYDANAYKKNYQGGLITRFYVFDENGNKLASLYTQNQIDSFIEEHKDKVYSYTWKAAIHLGENDEEVLIAIQNNEVVPSKESTNFISYKPKTNSLTKK